MLELMAEPSRELPIVGITVALRVGAVHEPVDKSGLGRLVARMLRRGCEGLAAEQIDERLDALGAELGVSVGLGSTALHVECLSRSLDQVVELVSALLATPTFVPQELGKLVRQTEAEIVESRDNDGFLAGRALRRQLFAGHPHAVRVGGVPATLRRIGREELCQFHAERYHRDHALVGIWGDVESSRVEAIAERLLARLPRGAPAGYPVPEPAPPVGRRMVVVDKPDRNQTQMVLGTLGTRPTDDDHVALLVANVALGGTFSSRLVQEIRAKRGWSYGASSHLAVGRVRESFSAWCAPSAADAPACLSLLLELVARWQDEGISDDELRFCQSYLRRSYAFEIDTPKKRVGQGLDRLLLGLPDDYHSRLVERIGEVTLEQARAAVRRRIDPDRLWVSVVGTDAEIGGTIRAAVPGLAQALVVPYDDE